MKNKIGKDNVNTRGRTFVGTVISDKIPRTVTVQWGGKKFIPKYERYTKVRTKVQAHDTLNAKKGDVVKISECKPLSKTKKFIVKEIIGRDIDFMEKQESVEEAQEVIEKKLRTKDNKDESDKSKSS